MANIEVNGQTVELDEDGFLVKLDQWNEDVARYLAKEYNIVSICSMPSAIPILYSLDFVFFISTIRS